MLGWVWLALPKKIVTAKSNARSSVNLKTVAMSAAAIDKSLVLEDV